MRINAILPLSTALIAASAAPALAAPDRDGALSAAAMTYAWDGGPVTGVGEGVDDDTTWLKVATAGSLTVALGDGGPTAVDIDIEIFAADDAGDATGDALASSVAIGPDESVSLDVETGGYVVRVHGFVSIEGTYKGTATLTPAVPEPVVAAAPAAVPPPAVGPPASDADPTAAITRATRTGFAGTAADDGAIARIDVGLVRIKRRRCAALDKRGAFKAQKSCAPPRAALRATGTTSWSVKLKRRLAAGSYVVYVTAVDAAGNKRTVKKAFKVR